MYRPRLVLTFNNSTEKPLPPNSKFAAYGFMESLGAELHGATKVHHSDDSYIGAANIKTTVVCPYFIATGMFTGAGGRYENSMLMIKFMEKAS